MQTEVITIAVRALEFVFFAGLAGSAIVVLMSGVEDLRDVFAKSAEEEPEAIQSR